jgi:hypothetical protein
LKRAGSLRAKYLTHLSHPPQDRRVYQAITRIQPQSILEIGIGSGERASRMIELALRFQDPKCLRYIGIDLFEGRPAQNPGLTLKRAYSDLLGSGTAIRLIPGEASHVLPLAANGLGRVDLVLISGDQDIVSDSRAWFYFPRILGSDALVFEEKPSGRLGRGDFSQLSLAEIQSRADAIALQFRRAA